MLENTRARDNLTMASMRVGFVSSGAPSIVNVGKRPLARGAAPQREARRSARVVRCSAARKAFLWTGWVTYVGVAFFSDIPPPPSVLNMDLRPLKEALDLSLNFWYFLPVLFPKSAPVVHPMLEALFNITVIYGMMLLGFLSDGGEKQRVKVAPFVGLTAFLTNVFYILYLALRVPKRSPPTEAERSQPLMKAAEGKGLPLLMLTVAVVSVLWGVYGRADGGFGDLSTRLSALGNIIRTDRLAWTFAFDCSVFTIIQAWLVPDDLARRSPTDRNLQAISIVPFFGLVYYFLTRPPLRSPADNKGASTS